MVDRKGNLWACTTGKGAIEIEKNGQYTIYNSENGVSSDKIRTTIELKNGDIFQIKMDLPISKTEKFWKISGKKMDY